MHLKQGLHGLNFEVSMLQAPVQTDYQSVEKRVWLFYILYAREPKQNCGHDICLEIFHIKSIFALKDELAMNGRLPFMAIFADTLSGCSKQILLYSNYI